MFSSLAHNSDGTFSLNSKIKKKNPDVEEGNLENHGEQELAEQAPSVNLLEHGNKSIFF